MIYLAVLLVLTGLLIVLVALFSESGKAGSAETTDFSAPSFSGHKTSVGMNPEDIDIIIPDRVKSSTPHYQAKPADEEDIFISFDKENDLREEIVPGKKDDIKLDETRDERLDEWGLTETVQDDIIPDSGPLEEISDSVFSELEDELSVPDERSAALSSDTRVYAVLFDDKSNLIDYDSGITSIEPSVSALKSIKRIGRGKVQVDDDGVSFYMDDKFYRFDFHKLYDVWSGPGFVALPLKGGSSVKLFMIDNAPDFPDRVEVYYQEYIKGN